MNANILRTPQRTKKMIMHNYNPEEGHHHHRHADEHGHTHGLIDPSIVRSKEGVRAVSLSFLALFITAGLQVGVFMYSNSVALLADLIHNFGDALTAIPLGLAFFFRSIRGEKWAGYFVVFLILVSALVAGYESIQRFFLPIAPTHLWALALAGGIGFLGNEFAAVIRTRAGKRLHSPALIADGHHAHVDGMVSLGVVASAILVALGLSIADPLVGLVITVLILRITWQSWQTIAAKDSAWL